MGACRPLRDRVARRMVVPRFRNGAPNYTPCHTWNGAHSQSGRRRVFYPVIGWFDKTLRVNRLVLILQYGPVEVPPAPEESFDAWLARALHYYRHWEAAHTCDNARCVNFTHLAWQGHAENIANQVARQRDAGREAAAS